MTPIAIAAAKSDARRFPAKASRISKRSNPFVSASAPIRIKPATANHESCASPTANDINEAGGIAPTSGIAASSAPPTISRLLHEEPAAASSSSPLRTTHLADFFRHYPSSHLYVLLLPA